MNRLIMLLFLYVCRDEQTDIDFLTEVFSELNELKDGVYIHIKVCNG